MARGTYRRSLVEQCTTMAIYRSVNVYRNDGTDHTEILRARAVRKAERILVLAVRDGIVSTFEPVFSTVHTHRN